MRKLVVSLFIAFTLVSWLWLIYYVLKTINGAVPLIQNGLQQGF